MKHTSIFLSVGFQFQGMGKIISNSIKLMERNTWTYALQCVLGIYINVIQPLIFHYIIQPKVLVNSGKEVYISKRSTKYNSCPLLSYASNILSKWTYNFHVSLSVGNVSTLERRCMNITMKKMPVHHSNSQ